jgi:hypothetical protein
LKVTIIDNKTGNKIDAIINKVTNHSLPSMNDGWKFDWNQLKKERNIIIYKLSLENTKIQSIEGLLILKQAYGMLIMDLLEIAPHNVGSGSKKKFNWVAECLIAFACRESFKIEGDFQGYLAFIAKQGLVNTYKRKYGAVEEPDSDRKMYIDDVNGIRLIKEYLI